MWQASNNNDDDDDFLIIYGRIKGWCWWGDVSARIGLEKTSYYCFWGRGCLTVHVSFTRGSLPLASPCSFPTGVRFAKAPAFLSPRGNSFSLPGSIFPRWKTPSPSPPPPKPNKKEPGGDEKGSEGGAREISNVDPSGRDSGLQRSSHLQEYCFPFSAGCWRNGAPRGSLTLSAVA